MTIDDTNSVEYDTLTENMLYTRFLRGLPAFRSEKRVGTRLDCYGLADALGISHQALYRWFDRGRIPPKKIQRLVELPKSTLTRELLLPFALD